MSLDEMGDNHLINSMRLLQHRVAEVYMKSSATFEAAGIKPDDLLPDIFQHMARELGRRKLEPPEDIGGRVLEI